MTEFRVDLPILSAWLCFDQLEVTAGTKAHELLNDCAADYRTNYAGQGPAAVPGIQWARNLFRSLDIEPTRRRPSSEALLRRGLADMPMPQINTLVDLGNWWSVKYLLPVGIYDRSAIVGSICLRRGEPGEQYAAIGNKTLNLEGRYLLADDKGPFGTPISDSLRTMVSTSTTEALVVIYAPEDYPRDHLTSGMLEMVSKVTEICVGVCTSQTLLPHA